jgi:hypothetical protein
MAGTCREAAIRRFSLRSHANNVDALEWVNLPVDEILAGGANHSFNHPDQRRQLVHRVADWFARVLGMERARYDRWRFPDGA